MNTQPKPLASLSSTLLARKGQARPAMRPQGFGGFGTMPGAQDDLGWNDMGHNVPPPVEEVAPSVPMPAPASVPQVLVQREILQAEIEQPVASLAPRTVSVATAQRISRETGTRQSKAAFTLRLDQERHLRLRLASALYNRSSQHLVTDALDAFLDNLPEVDALVRQIPVRATK